MRLIAWLLLLLALALPACAQQRAAPPHAWRFGAWAGGLYPPPQRLSAQECLAQPTIILTRDAALRMSLADPTYAQRLIETVRATRDGTAFRFVTTPAPPATASGLFNLAPQRAGDIPFGCRDPNALQVQRRGKNEIRFADCPAFSYSLKRCQSR